MSVYTDVAMDHAFHPSEPPTEAERVLVSAFRFGHISLEKLYEKLGGRAFYVCSQFGIMSSAPPPGQAPAPASPERPEDSPPLAHVSTDALFVELARRLEQP